MENRSCVVSKGGHEQCASLFLAWRAWLQLWRSTPVRSCTCNLHAHSEKTIINVIIYLCVIFYRSGKIQSALCLLATMALDVTVENASTSYIY